MPINFNNCSFNIDGNWIIGNGEVKRPSFKENNYLQSLPIELQILYAQMPQREYGIISVIGDGILQFQTEEHYENIIDILQDDCEKWDALFSERYAYMGFEEYNEFIDKIHYTPFLPLLLFEVHCGIQGKTLFDVQENLIRQWEDAGLEGVNPRDKVFNIESEQAVHSIYREVCIADTIYQYREDAIISVPLADFENWVNYRTASTDTLYEMFNVIKGSQNTNNSVQIRYFPFNKQGEVYSSQFEHLATDEKITWSYCGKVTIPFFQRRTLKITCQITSYKKNKKGKYKKFKRKCGISPHVTFYWERIEGSERSSKVIRTDLLPEEKRKSEVTVTRKTFAPHTESVISDNHGVLKNQNSIQYGSLASEKIVLSVDGHTKELNNF